MKRPPLIGVSGRRKRGDQLVGNLETLAHIEFDMYYSDYARGVLEAGGIPVYLPLDVDPTSLIDRLDGVLLSGGADIGPGLYNAAPETNDYPPEAERDAFEIALMDAAIDYERPTLGICRGIQMINVHAGGTLHQDVPPHAAFDQPPQTEWHEIDIEADSTLAELYGTTRRVNSLHHQTIDRLGAGLRVVARSPDGVIEGIEHESLPILGVQWHPEMMTGRSSDPVFAWFVEAAAAAASD